MTTPAPVITSEQINNLPLLLGILNDLGIRDQIDAHIRPHGHWQGASLGTLATIWLSHILQERSHTLLPVRTWAHDRAHTINTLLDITLRDTDCTDDRLANLLTKLGTPALQSALDAALMQHWIRVYHLPTDTVRLDTTSVSVYHATDDPISLMQPGQSKDHRPDLAQFKLMLASLDPLGLPLATHLVAGNRADDPLYVPAYHAACAVAGTRAVLVVGDSKMAALATRGTIVAGGSRYLCAYRPPSASGELDGWIADALAHPERQLVLTQTDARTGQQRVTARVDQRQREQCWIDPATQREQRWTERVLVRQSLAYQAGMQRRLERSLLRLSAHLDGLRKPPTQGRTRYATALDVQAEVAKRVAAAKLDGLVQTRLCEATTAAGKRGWVVEAVWVDWQAWQARVARLGWQVYVTNTVAEALDVATIEATYGQQAVQERSFSRLKTRTLHIRPLYVRDERRIAGLVWLLTLALRVLVVVEQRVRQALAARQEEVVGLNPASRTQATTRPTTERVLKAFGNLTRTRIEVAGKVYWHVSALNATQQHILHLLGLPPDLYDRLATLEPNLLLHLRE